MTKRRSLAAAKTHGAGVFDSKETPRKPPMAEEAPQVPPPTVPAPRIDGRTLRRTGRTAQLNIRVTPETDARIREIAQRDGLLIAEVIEAAIRAYDGAK